MRTYLLVGAFVLILLAQMGCVNMAQTQRNGHFDAVRGTAVGVGISALVRDGAGTGAVLGGMFGDIAGCISGHNTQK